MNKNLEFILKKKMLKYSETEVTFREVPDEISLVINITNCPYHCPGCHSKHLWEDTGERLTPDKLCDLIDNNNGISCVCFMGGDSDLEELYRLFGHCRLIYPELRICWYTARESIPKDLPKSVDYIKIGPYKEEFGPLNNPNTNQRFYISGRIMNKMDANSNMFYDITDKFWRN